MGGRPRVSIHISKATTTGEQRHCIQGHGIIVQGDIICRYVLSLIKVHLHWTRASTLRSVATRSPSEKQSNPIRRTRQTLRSYVNISNVFVCCKVGIAMFGITRGGEGLGGGGCRKSENNKRPAEQKVQVNDQSK